MHILEVRLGLLPCIEGVCREESWERGKTPLTWAYMNSTFSSSLKSMLLETEKTLNNARRTAAHDELGVEIIVIILYVNAVCQGIRLH